MMTLAELQKTLSRVADLKPTWTVELSAHLPILPTNLKATGKTSQGFSISLERQGGGDYESSIASIKITSALRGFVCSDRYTENNANQRPHYQVLEKAIVAICQRQFDANKANEAA